MEKREARQCRTILYVSVGLMIMYLIFDHKLLLFSAAGLAIMAIFSDWLRDKVSSIIIYTVKGLNITITTLLLTLVYLFILLPTARLQRFFFQNPVELSKTNKSSYFNSRDHIFTKEDFERTW
ncbi:MAG: hypothetical protein IMY70_06315 [Bacteroidetes bacterium]|nr:hypothetical protein [Bacteroidota bacterium]